VISVVIYVAMPHFQMAIKARVVVQKVRSANRKARLMQKLVMSVKKANTKNYKHLVFHIYGMTHETTEKFPLRNFG